MSMFLVHQSATYTLLLADSLARRHIDSGPDTVSMSASKLVRLNDEIFAAHAGTWQPAMAMLSDLASLLTRPRERPSSHKTLCSALTRIGSTRFAEFQSRWKDFTIDVRIALVVTGKLRDPRDIQDKVSSSILLWEAARAFKPIRVSQRLCFASNVELSKFVSDLLSQKALEKLLRGSPLTAAQALLATHAASAHMSDSISEEANLILIGTDQRYCTLRGQVLSLPCAALLEG